MNEFKVYDKVSWHFPEGENCPDVETAKAHLKVVMKWLREKNYLTKEGEEAYDIGIESDFSLTSALVTKQGNAVLQECYERWLNSIDYGTSFSYDYFDECIERIERNLLKE
jgi:hypothetical protein